MLPWKQGFRTLRWNIVWAICTALFIVLFFKRHIPLQGLSDQVNQLQTIVKAEDISVSGFVRTYDESRSSCYDGLVEAQLQVMKSEFMACDLVTIAGSIDHAMINYTNLPDLTFLEQVEKTWAAIAGSSVWLQRFGVYFTVKRVFYYNRSNKYHPKISFIYAQILNEAWQPLKSFNVSWQGEDITFPRVLDIAAPFTNEGRYYGPEDPRIILEQAEDAEPVIVFNMMSDVKTKARHMYVHRPFSNVTARLQIKHQTPRKTEKNWSPFFLSTDRRAGEKVGPSEHIHFVYDWHPLTILCCHLLNGYCFVSYRETLPEPLLQAEAKQDKATKDVVHGGSNLELLQLSPAGCKPLWDSHG